MKLIVKYKPDSEEWAVIYIFNIVRALLKNEKKLKKITLF